MSCKVAETVTIVSIIFLNGKCISFLMNKEPFYIQFETF